MQRLIIWLVVSAATLSGQQYGRGKTSISAPYNPHEPAVQRALPRTPSLWARIRALWNPPPKPRTPAPRPAVFRRGPDEPGFYRKHTTIPIEEYIRRKDALRANAPLDTGPPGVETISIGPGRRAPGDVPAALANNPSLTFEGPQQIDVYSPPDPDMAAGPEDLIAVVNSRIVRYSKSGALLEEKSLKDWFGNLISVICPNPSGACNFYDPTVRYDSLHGRFLVCAISEDTTTLKSYFVLSVSRGATYGGGWKNWALEGSRNGSTQTFLEIDFPQTGYDNSAVYLTADMFNVATYAVPYAKIRILKKSELYNASTTTLTFQDIWDLKNEDGTTAFSLRPAIVRGNPGLATPGLLINASLEANADHLTLWRIQNPTSNTPSASRTTVRNLLKYDLPARFPQLGSGFLLDSSDTRVLRAIQRNGVLYTARPTGYATIPTTITYDRISLASNTATVQQRLTGGNFFYPAFDVPASHGPTDAIPAKLVTGSTTNAQGALTYAGVPQVKAGVDAFEFTTLRWGDYFGASIDPVLSGLWVYGEYARAKEKTSGRWGTAAAYFPITTTAQFSDVPSTSPYFDYANILKLWSITSGCTGTTYCPTSNVTRGQMAVFIVRSIVGDDFTFPSAPYFTDVPSTHSFYKYIQKLRELGITAGCTATTFCPESNVTRGEMAVFLVRGKLRSLHQDDFPFPSPAYFTDVPTTHVFFKFVQKLRELGVTTGCGTTTFCPAEAVTRDQMAVFLTRGFLN